MITKKKAKFKKVKLLICRELDYGDYEIAENKPESIEGHDKHSGFSNGYLSSFCARKFKEIFSHLGLKKGQRPVLIEVSAKILKMPKKKTKKGDVK